MSVCNGNGECLRQSGFENNYEKDTEIKCNYNCKPIKCPNYLVCESLNPQWLYYCHKNLCISCAINGSGNLSFCEEMIECPICLDNKTGVKQINCEHFICTDCFKRCRYGERREYPNFPYSEDIHDEYSENPEDNKWKNEYPLIEKWEQSIDLMDDYYHEKYENEENLRRCPLCRR